LVTGLRAQTIAASGLVENFEAFFEGQFPAETADQK